MQNTRRFFIPDFTVGLGFSPSLPVPVGENRVAEKLVDYTTGEEFHLALKQTFFFYHIWLE